jgi:two-component system, OmpR family, copper resistance phosphate regulon response regulator CusR
MIRVLVVDDDPRFRAYLRSGLTSSGIESEEAPDGYAALEVLQSGESGHFDLILLDVMMPESSGWQILEQLRARGDETPTIFVTARDAVEERVKGLELGADDYIIKPFDLSELLARVEAVIRRRSFKPLVESGSLRIDLVRRSVSSDEGVFELATKEFDLLLALVRAQGRVLSRTELLKEVWGIEFDPETNLVDVYIARLRRRLRSEGPGWIVTVRGQGYRFEQDPDD